MFYTISDGNGGTATASISFTVEGVNDAPIALDDTAVVDEDASVTVAVLANDSDIDEDVLSVSAGYSHSLALKSDSTVVAWGDNSSGQTDTDELSSIVAVSGLTTMKFAPPRRVF